MQGDPLVCHPSQRSPTQFLADKVGALDFHDAPAPMGTSRAGSSIKIMFGGNGHSRGDFGGVKTGDPGRVAIYWAGAVEREIT